MDLDFKSGKSKERNVTTGSLTRDASEWGEKARHTLRRKPARPRAETSSALQRSSRLNEHHTFFPRYSARSQSVPDVCGAIQGAVSSWLGVERGLPFSTLLHPACSPAYLRRTERFPLTLQAARLFMLGRSQAVTCQRCQARSERSQINPGRWGGVATTECTDGCQGRGLLTSSLTRNLVCRSSAHFRGHDAAVRCWSTGFLDAEVLCSQHRCRVHSEHVGRSYLPLRVTEANRKGIRRGPLDVSGHPSSLHSPTHHYHSSSLPHYQPPPPPPPPTSPLCPP